MAALAVLNAIDVTMNTKFKWPVMYNYGGPRSGDPAFAFSYDNLVRNSIRVVNQYDIFTKLPYIKTKFPNSDKVWHYAHVSQGVSCNL